MVTSSKRAYARGCVTQVCCTQSPCPCGKPLLTHASAAAAAKSLQLCATLCDPIDGSLPGPSVPGILQARIPEWVAISFSTCLCRRLKHTSGSVSVGSLCPEAQKILFEPSEHLWPVWGSILNAILPLLPSCWGFPLPFDVGYLILVGSNILLLMLVQQWVLILEFSQEKMSTPHP